MMATILFNLLVSSAFGLGLFSQTHAARAEENISIPLRIKVHHALRNAASPDKIAKALSSANRILEMADDPSDTACPVRFVMSGEISFSDDLPDEVNNNSFDALKASQAEIFIVPLIWSCNSSSGNVLGCTWPGAFVTIGAASVSDGQVVAHELGHLMGLPDVREKRRVMRYSASQENKILSKDECETFRSSTYYDPNLDSVERVAGPEPGDQQSVDVADLLDGSWLHGVTGRMKEIRALSSASLIVVRNACKVGDLSRQTRARWILAIRGSKEDIICWRDILDNGNLKDPAVLKAKAEGLTSLGVFYSRFRSAEASKLLDRFLYISDNKPIGFADPSAKSADTDDGWTKMVVKILSRAAMRGRAASGTLIAHDRSSGEADAAMRPGSSPDLLAQFSPSEISALNEANLKAQRGDLDGALKDLTGAAHK